jgi:hypothetical protein
MTDKKLGALKYDDAGGDYGEKLPWDLLPVESVEGMLRVLWYGRRKYTTCNDCEDEKGKPTKIYPNPRLPSLGGDPERSDCPKCGSTNISTGAHNWRKGFTWTRLIAASFRHLKAILQGKDIDDGPQGSGLPHVDHLLCMVAFLSGHQKCGYGDDDRWKEVGEKKWKKVECKLEVDSNSDIISDKIVDLSCIGCGHHQHCVCSSSVEKNKVIDVF